MLTWALLGAGALAYLGTFAINALPPAEVAEAPTTKSVESVAASKARDELQEQVRNLHETVASLRTDLARLKASEQSREARAPAADKAAASDEMAGSVTPAGDSIEPFDERRYVEQESGREAPAGTSDLTTASLPPVVAQEPGAETERAKEPVQKQEAAEVREQQAKAKTAAQEPKKRGPNLATSPLRRGKLPPLPPMGPKRSQNSAAAPSSSFGSDIQATLLNSASGRGAPATTAPQQVAAFKPQNVARDVLQPDRRRLAAGSAAQGGRAALSLSLASSVTGLRASWLLLSDRYGSTLAGYQPRYVLDQASGAYRLIAGPIQSRADADRVCTELRAQNVRCGVTDFAGTPL